jgi:hypothetical protein
MARNAIFLNAGGAASDLIGKFGLKALQKAPEVIKNSFATDLALKGIKGAAFGTAGTAATYPTYGEDEKPTAKEFAHQALVGALFDMVPGMLSSVAKLRARIPEVKSPVEEPSPVQGETTGKEPIKGRFTVKNPALEKATQDWNDFVDYAQQRYGHYKLTDDEILQAAIDKGVDPDDSEVENVEVAH